MRADWVKIVSKISKNPLFKHDQCLKQNTCLWGRVLLTRLKMYLKIRLKLSLKTLEKKRTRGIKIRAVYYGFT